MPRTPTTQHYYTPSEALQMPPAQLFRLMIERTTKYGHPWLIEQLNRLHQEPQVQELFALLDNPSSFAKILSYLQHSFPKQTSVLHQLHQLNAESHAAYCRRQAQQFQQEAAQHLSRYQKLQRRLAHLLHS
jgi:hypothetical protein